MHVSLFRNEFNKFNNTGAQMLDSIYHIAFKLLKIAYIFSLTRNVKMDVTVLNMLTTSGLSILLHGVILLTEATSRNSVYIFLSI